MNSTYNEKHRLQYHFSPKRNWMNDPNGMVYFNGEYHLFFQHYPNGTTWGPMHWGHAVSKDLLHWDELPIALYPDDLGDIFSGSAVVDWHNTTGFFEEGKPGIVAIYTSAGKYPGTDRDRQRQSLAYSKDNGRTWVKYEGNPVLVDESITDYRDPKVFWYEETKRWIMVLATGQTITIYSSPNLKEWEFASEFGQGIGSHDGVWECPDLFQLGIDGDSARQKWVMLVSIGDNKVTQEGSRTQYFIGDFDGKTFVSENPADKVLWLDYGRDNYAGVSWSDIPDEDGRRIYIGWMSNWRYANQVPTEGWRSAMTLPRELSLTETSDGIRIVQLPVREVEQLRHQVMMDEKVQLANKNEYEIDYLSEVKVDFENNGATEYRVILKNQQNEQVTIGYNVTQAKLYLDRTIAGDASFSDSFAQVQEAPFKLGEGKLTFHIYVDTSSLEVFVNDGEIALTSLVFPSEHYDQVILQTSQSEAQAKLKITSLQSVWK